MLKEIPKSDITRRSFKTYKEWNLTESDITVNEAERLTDSNFDEDGAATGSGGFYKHSLWGSLNGQYYKNQQSGNPVLNFGDRQYWYSNERVIQDIMYVLAVPQQNYGEEIKRGSVRIVDNILSQTFTDDTYGNLLYEYPTYTLDELDLEDEIIVFSSEILGLQFTASISDIDFEDSTAVITYNGDTDTYTTVELDFEKNLLKVTEPFDFNDYIIPQNTIGNVFYDHGIVSFKGETLQNEYESGSSVLSDFNLNFNSTKTIYETEIFLPVLENEFNVSQNPTAVEYKYSDSGFATETHIKQSFVSSYDGVTTGTWDDYEVSSSLDQTGSYLAPYITTIGLYDNSNNMVAVAKLTKPIKSLPDYPVNFIVRLDT